MQTKSVLTALSLSILCSTTAFGMMPRLLVLATGATLGASPFIAREIYKAREGEELRTTVYKAKTEFDFEVREAKELKTLSDARREELEERKKKQISEALYKHWETQDRSAPQPQYRASKTKWGSFFKTRN